MTHSEAGGIGVEQSVQGVILRCLLINVNFLIQLSLCGSVVAAVCSRATGWMRKSLVLQDENVDPSAGRHTSKIVVRWIAAIY